MESEVIRDLAILVHDTRHCPVCKSELVITETLYKLPKGYFKRIATAPVLKCPQCKQYYGTWKIVNSIRSKYRVGGQKRGAYFPCHVFHNSDPDKNKTGQQFTVLDDGKKAHTSSGNSKSNRVLEAGVESKTVDVLQVVSLQKSLEKNELSIGDKTYNTYPLKDVHLEFYCKKVCPTRFVFKRCPFCQRELKHVYTFAVGINADRCIKSKGVVCDQCDTFFSTDCELFAELENIRIVESDYSLIKDYSCEFDGNYFKNLLFDKPSACRQFIISRPGEYRIYTIVTDMRDRDPINNVFHYTEGISLKIMTAYLLGEFWWELDGHEYFFVGEKNRNDTPQNKLPYISPSTPVSIRTKSNGGLFDINKDLVLLDAVAFFPSQGMLIPIRVTFDRKNGIYYIDGRLLEKYADQFGLMLCRFVSSSSRGWANLRDESLLHQLGYNVGQTDNLTSSYRQKILSQVMEAGIMKPAQIITLLKGLISRNGSVFGNEIARKKWEDDLAFVFNYNVKTQGFVVGAFQDL